MSPTLNEKFLAYLALISGLAISVVAEYYSILGLAAIFSSAIIPVIIMGIVLGVGKISATLWLKQNWNIAPWTVKLYLFTAILVLMLITSMGIFGFLSKAHSDQGLISGDALAKLSIFDEKIKTEKETIDVSRKALKQLDEAVDQVMGRSSDERGADKANQIRRSQQAERSRLQKDIALAQSNIGRLNEQRAPLAAEVRKVEAEVGPIKYIAAFVYGETDNTILEKAVIWVIIVLIIVFDPLAVILLLASQISFQDFRTRKNSVPDMRDEYDFSNGVRGPIVAAEGDSPMGPKPVVDDQNPTVASLTKEEKEAILKIIAETEYTDPEPIPHHPDTHPYLRQGFKYPEGWQSQPPMVYRPEQSTEGVSPEKESDVVSTATVTEESLFIQNEEQQQSNLWTKTAETISQEEYQAEALNKQNGPVKEWVTKVQGIKKTKN